MTEDTAYPAAPPPRTPMRVRVLAFAITLIVALLLAALIALVQRSNFQRDSALDRTRRSYNIVMLTSEADGSMARAEAALGRYVVDGDRRTGTTYYDEWRHAGLVLARLKPLLAAQPEQAARLAELTARYPSRGEELSQPAAHATYRQGWQALSLIARASRSDTLPRIAKLFDAIAGSERVRLDARSSAFTARTERSDSLARLLSVVGALLAVSLLALGWIMLSTLAERRVARETAEIEADRALLLERAVEQRTAELSEANQRLMEAAAVRDEAEAKLRQVQKMDAVGQLTGGIAHDFNNMLAVVLGGLELAKRRLDEQAQEAGRHLDSAMEGATRAAALTRRLLSFARAEPLLPSAVDPARLLTDLSTLIDRTIGERIVVRIEREAGVWPVWVDPYQLENAILNLAVNARDAMDGEGLLVMRAERARLREGEVGGLPGGDYVRIAVTDTGGGMSPAVLERVFEPFFTTKPVGEGTGLGLSQILGFARQSGGDVAIRSQPNKGTTVSVYLPRHQGNVVAHEARERALQHAAATDRNAILVVEDDPRVRAATSAALTELGYDPILSGGADEALAQLAERPDIRLVITDVVMPGMSGPELVLEIRARLPDIAILFVTGYVGEAGEAQSLAGHAVLRKPFTIRALSAAVADALAEPAAA